MFTFEKTPAYISYQYVLPQLIKEITPYTKIIITLRNPIERLNFEIQRTLLDAIVRESNRGTSKIMDDYFDNNYDEYERFFERIVGVNYRSTMSNYTNNLAIIDNNSTTTEGSSRMKQQFLLQPQNLLHQPILRSIYVEQLQPWLQYYQGIFMSLWI